MLEMEKHSSLISLGMGIEKKEPVLLQISRL